MTSKNQLIISAIFAVVTFAALGTGYPIDPKLRWELLSPEHAEAEDPAIWYLPPNTTRTTTTTTTTTTTATAEAEPKQDDDDAMTTAAKLGVGSLALLVLAIVVYILKKVRAYLAENAPENPCVPCLDILVDLFGQVQQALRR